MNSVKPHPVQPGTPTRSAAASTMFPPLMDHYFGFEASDSSESASHSHSAFQRWTNPILADSKQGWPRSARPRPAASPRAPRTNQPSQTAQTDMQAAATVYLKAVALTDGHDQAATLPPGDFEPVDPLFHALHQTSPASARHLAHGLISMPEPGDSFLGFHIVEELGRGAFGRVFLAHQGDLASRLVALKVSAELPGESTTLAQLQHTNIVPIFSAHQAPPLHAVCMPYFGRATLADLLATVESQASLPESGREFARVVNSRRSVASSQVPPASGSASAAWVQSSGSAPAHGPIPPVGPASLEAEAASETLQRISQLSYVDAVLWMGSRIADGLAHAHGRGILHRDLKPANVLMTDDGQPMILDFNLSEDMKSPVEVSATSAGGTLRYMSPEHLERFLGDGVEVDGRSDVFALGVMLYELLTGRPPFEVYPGHSIPVLRQMVSDRHAEPPRLRPFNPAITPAVESIVRHCLAPRLADRYAAAREVHEDIERHLTNFPLQHAPEPSLPERARKWFRRHPRVGSSSTVVAVAAVLLLGLTGVLMARSQRLARFEADAALARFDAAASEVHFALNPRLDDPARRSSGRESARRILNQYGVLDDPRWTTRPAVLALPLEDQVRLRDEVADLLMLLTQTATEEAAERSEGPARRDLVQTAQRYNGLALASFVPGREPRPFFVQQAALVRLEGHDAEADRLLARADQRPLQTARDYYLSAATLATAGDHARAIPLAEEAVRLDPGHFWSHFVLGVCHDQLDHHAEAMASFTACVALRPDFAESWLYRGMAHVKRNQLDLARADYDRAARLRPDWFEPPLHRALVERDQGDHFRAEVDLTRALDLGGPAVRIHFLRAAERRALGDRRGADADLAEGLHGKPGDVPGWISRGMARLEIDPTAALADFQAALRLNPRSLEAIQMSAYVLSDLPRRDEETIRMLSRGVELYPDYVPFRSGRGVQLAILGRRDAAHEDARETLWRSTRPDIIYQVAGIYATTSKTHPEDRLEAYRLLSTALRAGYGFDLIEIDHELDAIRDQPEFAALLDSARAQAKGRLRRTVGR